MDKKKKKKNPEDLGLLWETVLHTDKTESADNISDGLVIFPNH